MPSANTPPTLTLPGPLFSTLQPPSYLHHHLSTTGVRANTRTPATFRPLNLTTSSLTHCAGSAVLRTGDTSVVCGIQAETLLARDIPDPPRARLTPPSGAAERRKREQEDIARLGLLVPNVELNTGCSALHLPGDGRPPGPLQQSLSFRILRLLISSGIVRLEDLVIRRGGNEGGEEEEVVGYWVLYITLLPLSLAGRTSLFDALWAALYAALRDVKLPRAWWDGDCEMIVCSDAVAEARRLRLRGQPVACSFGVFSPGSHVWRAAASEKMDKMEEDEGLEGETRSWILADPDGFEDGVCEETVTLVVDVGKKGKGKTRILGVEKTGGTFVDAKQMKKLVQLAEERWHELARALPGG